MDVGLGVQSRDDYVRCYLCPQMMDPVESSVVRSAAYIFDVIFEVSKVYFLKLEQANSKDSVWFERLSNSGELDVFIFKKN